MRRLRAIAAAVIDAQRGAFRTGRIFLRQQAVAGPIVEVARGVQCARAVERGRAARATGGDDQPILRIVGVIAGRAAPALVQQVALHVPQVAVIEQCIRLGGCTERAEHGQVPWRGCGLGRGVGARRMRRAQAEQPVHEQPRQRRLRAGHASPWPAMQHLRQHPVRSAHQARLHAVAVGVAGNPGDRAGHVLHHGLRRQQPAQPAGLDAMALQPDDQSLRIALVLQQAAVRQRAAGQPPFVVIAVAGGALGAAPAVQHQADGARHDTARFVVAVAFALVGVLEGDQPAPFVFPFGGDAPALPLPGRRMHDDLAQDAPCHVVFVAGRIAQRIAAGHQPPGRVVAVHAQPAVGAGHGNGAAEVVVHGARGAAGGSMHRGGVALGIVLEADGGWLQAGKGRVAGRRDAAHPPLPIVVVAGRTAQRVDLQLGPALEVVAHAAYRAVAVDAGDHAAEAVVLVALDIAERAAAHAVLEHMPFAIEAAPLHHAQVRHAPHMAPGVVEAVARQRRVAARALRADLDRIIQGVVAGALRDAANAHFAHAPAAVVGQRRRLAASLDGDDAPRRVIAELAARVTRRGGGHDPVAALVPFELRDVGIGRGAGLAVGQRTIDGGQQAAAVDDAVDVAHAALDRLRRAARVCRRRPAAVGHRQRLPVRVVADARHRFLACDHTRARSQGRLVELGVFVTHHGFRRAGLAAGVADPAHRHRTAAAVEFGTQCLHRAAGIVELDGFDQAPEIVVAIADVRFAALGATGAAHFQQAVLAGQHAVAVDRLLPQAVGQHGLAGRAEVQAHAAAVAGQGAFDRPAVRTVGVGGKAFHLLAVAYADPGEEGRQLRVFVVVIASLQLVGIAHRHQAGQQQRLVHAGAFRERRPVAVAVAAEGTVDRLNATESVAAAAGLPVEVIQAQLAPLRVGNTEQQPRAVVLQRDELAGWRQYLDQLACIVKAQLGAVVLLP